MNAFFAALRKKWYLFVLLGIPFLIGTGIILYTTSIGPWAFSDSAVYIWSARNLASGIGLVVQNTTGGFDPLTWFTPFFPLLVSIPVSLGADAVQAARWINAISFGLILSMAGYMTWRAGKSFVAGITAVILLLVQPGIVKIFSGAVSEPLFLVITLAALFMAYMAVISPDKKGLWLAGGALAGLSFLTRYTGIATIGTVLAAAVFTRAAQKERLHRFMWAAFSALMPAVIWYIISATPSGSPGGRHFVMDQNLFSTAGRYFQALWDVVLHWIPYITRGNQIISPLGKFVLLIVVISGSYVYFLKWVQKKGELEKPEARMGWATIWLMFSAIYLLFHLLSYLILIEKPDVDMRLLSPVFLSWVLMLASLLSLIHKSLNKKPAGVLVPILIMAGYVLYFGRETLSLSQQLHSEGLGYTSKRWQTSQLLGRAAAFDAVEAVYSNDPALVLFYHGYFPRSIELPVLADSGEDHGGEGVYIIFYPQAAGIYGEKTDDLFANIAASLTVVYEDKDGGIFTCGD